MQIEKDYEELLRLFNKNKVKYCIVGRYAVAFYAEPRYTKDIDILVKPDIENAKKVIKCLNEFGFRSLKLNEKDLSKKGKIIQLGYEPVRIDLLTSISGCDFDDVWKNRSVGTYGQEKVYFTGLNELIKNKRASKRKTDTIDLDILLYAKNKRRKRRNLK